MTTARDRLALLLRLLVHLNIIDTILTLIVIGLKWATETNPIMDYFLQQGPLVFGATKLLLTLSGALLLWKARRSKWSARAAYGLVLCYGLVVAYELTMVVAMIGVK